MSGIIKNRYDFTVLFDVENGNPNGDPDAGNMPRMDADAGYGLVSDVCLKRKIRNYVETVKDNETGFKIYIKGGETLNKKDAEAFKYHGVTEETAKTKKSEDIEYKLKDFMCSNYYDIRTFGAVMTTFTRVGLNCGQVRGPVQFGFAKSVDRINPQEITITRCAVTTEKDAVDKVNTMGNKYIIPYALYRVDGYVSANLAKKSTGFSEEDLELLWEAILNMFEVDHAAARGKMTVRKLIIFKHSNELGNCASHKLFDTIKVKRNTDELPRAFSDYTVKVCSTDIPAGVNVIIKE